MADMIERDKALALTPQELGLMPLLWLKRVAETIGADTIGCENRGDVIVRIVERQMTWQRRRLSAAE